MHATAPSNGTVPAPSQHGASYTLHDAAELLGCSLNTLRRKIKAGEIHAERVSRPQGHTWHVFLPLHGAGTVQHRSESTVQAAPFTSTVPPAPFNGTGSTQADVAPLVDLVRDLTDRLHQQGAEHATELVCHAE